MQTQKEDLREEIVDKLITTDKCVHTDAGVLFGRKHVYEAMDTIFERRSMELLEYMGKKNISCGYDAGGAFFLRNGAVLTKEQIFENFL